MKIEQLTKGVQIQKGEHYPDIYIVQGTIGDIVFLTNDLGGIPYMKTINYLNDSKNGYKIIEKDWSASDLKKWDTYWYVDTQAVICNCLWENDRTDNFRLKSKNIFKDEASASKRRDEILNS